MTKFRETVDGPEAVPEQPVSEIQTEVLVGWCSSCETLVFQSDYSTEVLEHYREGECPFCGDTLITKEGEDVDKLLAVVARMQGEIDALKAELAEARKPLTDAAQALVDAMDAVTPAINNAFVFSAIHGGKYDGPTYGKQLEALRELLASRTAPEPVKTGGCAPPVLASTPELVMCANCDDPIIEGPSSFWTHRAGHSCCGPNRFAKPPAGAAQDDIVVQICRVMAPHLYGLLLEECNEKAVGRLRDAVAAALAIAREGWICRGEMTEYKPLYEELIKRLEGAHIVASLPGIFEWSHTIEELIKATNAQKHLAQLATDRYEKILELERKLAEPHEGYYSAELVEKALRGFYALPYGPEANDLVRVVFYLLAKEAK